MACSLQGGAKMEKHVKKEIDIKGTVYKVFVLAG
jgi:hypothetical protein